MSEIFLKSELFRTFLKFQINKSGVRFFSDVQNFSEPQIFCQVADEDEQETEDDGVGLETHPLGHPRPFVE